MTARRRLVRVPASSANLGPGYDAMAAAVALHLELEVEETGEYSFDPGGQDLPTGRDNLLVRAFESLHSADGIAFRLRSDIPLARGLGSSAAAIVAGLYAADHLFELALDKEEMLVRATAIEGHPDNVAAAIYGGFVVCGTEPAGADATGASGGGAGADAPFAARFDPPDGLEGIAVIPAEEVSTELARKAIPATVPLADAVANVSSAALLVLGLRSADLDLVSRGLVDRLHQPHRRSLYPRSMEIVDAAAELGALGATISGAGPTVLVWTTWQDAGGVTAALRERAAGWAEVRRLPFTPQGPTYPSFDAAPGAVIFAAMPTKTLSKLFAAVLAAAALLAVPAAANAELAFVKGLSVSSVYQANNDGSGIHKIGRGRAPKVSPNGKFIAYEGETTSHQPLLNIAPVSGGKVVTMMTGLRESYEMKWSPDSEMFVAIKGNELGRRKLVLFDLAEEEERTIASGYFDGVTFSPDGSELAYGMATSERFPLKSDIYRVSTGEGEPKAITRDHNSSYPLWSNQGEIAFVKELGAKTRQYAPKNEIYLMDRQGKNVRRLTHSTVSQLSQGLTPTAWSENGARLLTQFGGQDITYAVTVNPKTGAQKPLVEETEQGFIGAALSKNGKVVLGAEGGFEGGGEHFVGTVPYGGGKARVLVRNAYDPSWNR